MYAKQKHKRQTHTEWLDDEGKYWSSQLNTDLYVLMKQNDKLVGVCFCWKKIYFKLEDAYKTMNFDDILLRIW